MNPAVASVGPDHCVATSHSVLIQLWRTGTSLSAARTVRATARRLAAEREGALATIIVVEAGASMPAAEARAELSAMVDDQRERMAAAALVHEGNGFQAATVRAVMTGLMLVTRHPCPHRIFATVDEGCHWLRATPRIDVHHIDVLPDVIQKLRSQMR